jgi:hypothetical protein
LGQEEKGQRVPNLPLKHEREFYLEKCQLMWVSIIDRPRVLEIAENIKVEKEHALFFWQ